MMIEQRIAILKVSKSFMETLLAPRMDLENLFYELDDLDWLRKLLCLPDDCKVLDVIPGGPLIGWNKVGIEVESMDFLPIPDGPIPEVEAYHSLDRNPVFKGWTGKTVWRNHLFGDDCRLAKLLDDDEGLLKIGNRRVPLPPTGRLKFPKQIGGKFIKNVVDLEATMQENPTVPGLSELAELLKKEGILTCGIRKIPMPSVEEMPKQETWRDRPSLL